jgi:hypothetical protein
MDKKPVYAEQLPYWKTSAKTSAEAWREKTENEIRKAGGVITASGDVQQMDKAALFIAFTVEGEPYKIVWPVLQSRSGDFKAAKIQAASMMYYDVKSRCVAVRVLGARMAFGGFRVLPDGNIDGHVSTPELAAALPLMLVGGV